MQGIDYLGAAKFERTALRNLPTGGAVGVFAKTFGDALPFVKKVLAKGLDVRVHLIWKDDHKFGDAEHKAAVKEAKRWRGVSDQYGAKLQISPWCEHREANKAKLEKLRVAIMKELPNCDYVNTPLDAGALMSGVVNEVHHSRRIPGGRWNYSFDGTDCCESDIAKARKDHAGCEKFFLWTSRFNGKWEAADDTPRPNRKGWPDDKMCRSILAQFKQKESVKLSSSRDVYKSHAENDGDGNSRAEKMVFVTERAGKCEFLFNGRVVETLRASGRLDDGRFVHRSTKWGYEFAKKYAICSARVGGKDRGTFDPVFKQNGYKG